MNDIYEPMEDSDLLKKHIKNLAKGRVLDMGTGSGIQAIEASKYAEQVLAVDINPKAIEYCKKNILIDNITFTTSNLFKNVEGKFDLVMFNPPYLPQDKGIEDLALYGGKEGNEIIIRFLEDVKDYLKKNGKILLIFSSFSNPDKILKKAEALKLRCKLIEKQHMSFEDIFLYELQDAD